jgi:hypothetical protein
MCKKISTSSRAGTVLSLAAVAMTILGLATNSGSAGEISYVQITDDADSDISVGKRYTHKLDFGTGSPGALINGVQFDAYNNAANGTLNFNREVITGLLSDHAGNGNHNVSGSLVDLLTDMYYNGNNAVGGSTMWTLSGLTPGHTYNTRIYTRQWGANNDRTATIVFDPDGDGPISDSTGPINQDDASGSTPGFANANDAYYINYQFTAVAGEDLMITLTQNLYNQSWHLYGLTNEIAGPVTKAYGPSPKDGALHEETWITLNWLPGDYAVSHDVYLGDNFDDVYNGTGDTFRGNMADTMLIAGFVGFPFPDGLIPGTTYYWRIDEVNDVDPNSPWKGDVWSFWIPPKKAYEAIPADGAQFVLSDVILQWTAGYNAKLHTIYFGDNFDEVDNASGGMTQIDTTFTPGVLESGKTYYWRVDEFDPPATHKGDVWSFTTVPIVPISDPNLVGWWKLDEGYGVSTVDWSGHVSHGIISYADGGLGEGGSVWDTDPDRGVVLSFNGNDSTGGFVSAGGVPEMTLTNDFTWSFWTKQHPDQSTDIAVAGNNLILGNRYSYTGSDPLEFVKFTPARFEFYNNDPDYLMTIDYIDVPSGVWIHHAGVKDGTTLTYYRNGIESGSSTITKTIQANPFYMAGEPAGGGRWRGWLSDVRLYDKALTVDEIRLVMRGDPLLAWDPEPASGSTPNIGDAIPLTWSPGDSASEHAVYFGTDRGAVDNADATDTTGVYRGRQTATSYSPPEGVEWGGGPYYWRVDEHNTDATVTKGKIWSFSVADYLTVDDFESYNDIEEGQEGSNRIYLTWIDGYGTTNNGSQAGNLDPPFMSQGRKSAQAMPLHYDNAGRTSEATRTLVSGKDWTKQGVTKLSIWFRGDSANAADRMFVALSNAIVYHPDDAATQDSGWNEWVIDLQEFTNQGTDLTNVGSITLGFGTRGAPVATGGTGTVHFDDIRLYR